MKVLLNRRSIRRFKPEQIKDEDLKQILEAGEYAPTAKGLQSPFFIAVQDKEDIVTINNLSRQIMGRDFPTPYYGAPTLILVFYDRGITNDEFGVLDASAAITNMLNAAYALGLGSCWIHRCHQMFEMEEGRALLKKWGIIEDLVGVASLAVGYADQEQPQPRPRKENFYKIVK